jgi:hypothetical protein
VQTAVKASDSKAKLRELMLYIANKAESIPRFGSIKLNKVLFYSDFLWYGMTGEPITGVMYVKEDYGPAPCGLLSVQEDIRNDGDATLELRPVFPRLTEKRLVPKRQAELKGLFEPEQIAFIDNVIEWIAPATAKDVSEATHQHLGWRLAEYRAEIPYYTVFLNDDIARPSDIKRGQELAGERGWLKDSTLP